VRSATASRAVRRSARFMGWVREKRMR